MANAYLDKKRKEHLALLAIGETVGRQQVTDMMATILSDYAVMGNKKLRPEEVAEVIRESGRRLSHFWSAWCKDNEADMQRTMRREALFCLSGIPGGRSEAGIH